jgi:hypothetical protein
MKEKMFRLRKVSRENEVKSDGATERMSDNNKIIIIIISVA